MIRLIPEYDLLYMSKPRGQWLLISEKVDIIERSIAHIQPLKRNR